PPAAGRRLELRGKALGAARRYLDAGGTFVAVGVDTTLLARGAERLGAQFKPAAGGGRAGASGGDATY
ncbi:4-hydroxy-2-oxo-heptane-1,7-dioate aldolase, partial [Burkholderia thailandensis]|nr:4-hydroxy-2-oxo-heptane-1,7-dioate aldolase [Burkholderia thailandensis]